jgi:DHA1 family bicyclomycin/chloramphenicol resistance-like MFS transporter
MSHLRLALAMAMTVAIAPLALDAYLPAFPDLAAFLGVSVHEISLSISVYVGALSLGQLVGGPLTDRYGRQPIMLGGLAIFAVCSFLISQAETLGQLLSLRALQAFGGGWVSVCVPAIVRDRVRGVEAAKLFSLIGLITVSAPAVAPALGSLLLKFGGWASIFLFLGCYGIMAVTILKFSIFSRRSRNAAAVGGTAPAARLSVVQRYIRVFRTPMALRFILLQAAVFSIMMLFITHASFIYQEHFGVSAGLFSVFFGANVVAMAIIMLGNRWLLSRFSPLSILRGAVALQALAVAVLVIITQFLPLLWLFLPAIMLAIGSIGAISPNCQACYMEHFGEGGGTAAALMGATQFGIAGIVSALSTLMPESIQAVVLAQALCAMLALALAWWPTRTGTEVSAGVRASL